MEKDLWMSGFMVVLYFPSIGMERVLKKDHFNADSYIYPPVCFTKLRKGSEITNFYVWGWQTSSPVAY